MSLVRITSAFKDGGHTCSDYKIVILCQINEQKYNKDGEWFGYVKNKSIIYPFILQDGKRLFYGDKEHKFQPTNIGSRPVESGSYFTLQDSPDDPEAEEIVYEIINIHQL